ncbi:MAG: hypothetical protein ABIP28_14890 [Mucilaginibacter sp.]
MKHLTIKLVLPLTVILFALLTKWWCVKVDDAPNTILQGFPLPFTGPAWGSSMSFQYFLLEFLIDFGVYFLFVFTITYLIHRFLIHKKPHNMICICLFIVAGLCVCLQGLMIYSCDSFFYLHREFSINVINVGYIFLGEKPPNCY